MKLNDPAQGRGGEFMRLRIESNRGSPVNDYRIIEGHVEFRVLDSSGHPYASRASCWRTLDENEIHIHHALNTIVSKWLRARRGDEPSPKEAGLMVA
jgi:hypothetical protein